MSTLLVKAVTKAHPGSKGRANRMDHSMEGVSRSHRKKSMCDERYRGDHLSGENLL